MVTILIQYVLDTDQYNHHNHDAMFFGIFWNRHGLLASCEFCQGHGPLSQGELFSGTLPQRQKQAPRPERRDFWWGKLEQSGETIGKVVTHLVSDQLISRNWGSHNISWFPTQIMRSLGLGMWDPTDTSTGWSSKIFAMRQRWGSDRMMGIVVETLTVFPTQFLWMINTADGNDRNDLLMKSVDDPLTGWETPIFVSLTLLNKKKIRLKPEKGQEP